jgi:hypothetical protein
MEEFLAGLELRQDEQDFTTVAAPCNVCKRDCDVEADIVCDMCNHLVCASCAKDCFYCRRVVCVKCRKLSFSKLELELKHTCFVCHMFAKLNWSSKPAPDPWPEALYFTAVPYRQLGNK